jgi:hypothetical protein
MKELSDFLVVTPLDKKTETYSAQVDDFVFEPAFEDSTASPIYNCGLTLYSDDCLGALFAGKFISSVVTFGTVTIGSENFPARVRSDKYLNRYKITIQCKQLANPFA